MKETRYPQTRHLCVKTTTAIDKLKEGVNLLDTTPTEAMKVLMKQLNDGKEFYTGCDNEMPDGSCGGHYQESKLKESNHVN